MSSKRACLIWSVLVVSLFAAPKARAATDKASDSASQCISPASEKTLAECPGGPAKFDAHKKRAAAFQSAPPPREVKSRKDDVKPVNPEELKKYAERDTRKNRLQARARALHSADTSA